MGKIICSLIKIFEKENHRDDFLNGSLYMNRLKVFQKIKNQEINNRSDPDEATSGWYQPNKGDYLEVNGYKIPPEDFDGPIKVSHDKFKELNVFCLSALYGTGLEQITEENLDAFRRSLMFDNKILDLGDYCVIIISPSAFIEKVKSGIQRNNLKGWVGSVEYFDPNIFHGAFSGIEPVFKKQIQFSHQKEYRIVIDSKTSGDTPYILEIGSIRDICKICKTGEVNKLIEVKLPQNV